MFRSAMATRLFCRCFSLYLLIFWAIFIPIAKADIIPTEALVNQEQKDPDREKILNLLARNDVQNELSKYGITKSAAEERINSLTDEEIIQLSQNIDQAPAGGGAVGAVVGAILIIFLILLLTDILGLTKVYPFTRSVNHR